MPKIKNWSRDDIGQIVNWDHDKSDKSVFVIKSSDGKAWNLWRDGGSIRGKKSMGRFKTKSEAKEAAVKWMRNHPME